MKAKLAIRSATLLLLAMTAGACGMLDPFESPFVSQLPTPAPLATLRPLATPIAPPRPDYHDNYTLVLGSPFAAPQPTASLPIDSPWLLVDDNASTSCSNNRLWALRTNTKFELPVMGYATRSNRSPLVVSCEGETGHLTIHDFESNTATPVRLDPGWRVQLGTYVLSPDSKEMAFTAVPDDHSMAWQIFATDVATGSTRSLLTAEEHELDEAGDGGQAMAWREDGLYYITFSSGDSPLWRATWDTGRRAITKVFDVNLLGPDVTTFSLAARAPLVAYRLGNPLAWQSPPELHIRNMLTGQDTLVDEGRGYRGLAFSQDGSILYYLRTSMQPAAYRDLTDLNYDENITYVIPHKTMFKTGRPRDSFLDDPRHRERSFNAFYPRISDNSIDRLIYAP